MIEVLFGESSAGAMKVAKNRAGKSLEGWIEGTSEEVVCLGFMMDIGDIREPMESPYRKRLLYSLYARDRWEAEEELKSIGDVYAGELRRLESFLEAGEPVRIWYSDAPYSRCGLYSLCRRLEKHEGRFSVVKLPEYVVREKCIVSRSSWNEVAAEEFAGFLKYETPLSREEIRRYAMLWHMLVEENSPLRAVVNGTVLSVPEDFYDFLIWRHLKDVPMREGRLLGDILDQTQLGVGDWWYAGRIEHHIRQGRIRVVEDSDRKYARMICRWKD